MQQRRYRPGDVLDDYCPRERRITDHAIVAMIDDNIKQTRCVVCDAEHEYKDGKVPPQRRKKPQAALFAQVLEGLQGPQPARVAVQDDGDDEPTDLAAPVPALVGDDGHDAAGAFDAPDPVEPLDTASTTSVFDVASDPPPARDEGPWRRQLIRAALPRPEGQPPPQTRPIPEFTIRQPNNNRGQRHGRRRSGGGQGQAGNGHHGPMRFGRSAPGQGQGQGAGRSRRRRGGKKNG